MGFPSGRYLPSASLPLRAALRGSGLVLLTADLSPSKRVRDCVRLWFDVPIKELTFSHTLEIRRTHEDEA